MDNQIGKGALLLIHSWLLVSLCACARNSNITAILAKAADNLTSPVVVPLACDSTLTSSYGGGTGTSLDPYAICSLAQWKHLGSDSANWSKAVKLYADIDFTGITTADFTVIGNATTAFTGSLDGNNFKLINLNLTGITSDTAFFGQTNSPASFQKINLKNVSLTSSTANARISGFILDHGNGGALTISNVILDNVNLVVQTYADTVGGLVGTSASQVNFDTVTMTNVNLTGPSSTSDNWGGVIGYSDLKVSVSNLTATNLTVSAGSLGRSGGLIGQIYTGGGDFTDITITGLNGQSTNGFGGIVYAADGTTIFTRVHITGSIQGNTDAGGFIDQNWGGSNPSVVITESSFSGTIYGSFYSGGLIGISFGRDVTVSNSFAKGVISVWNGLGGGLIGTTQGATANVSITDSYAAVNISNAHPTSVVIGGLIGQAQGHVVITRAFASGSLIGTAPRACIGKTASAASYITTQTYYNSTLCTAMASTSGAIAGTTGLATAALQTGTPFSGAWLPSTWVFTNGQNPKLAWEP